MINKEPFHKTIQNLKDEGKYRVFNDILRERGNFPKAIWYSKYAIKNITNWCSNDYLGMGQNPIVIKALTSAIDSHGTGAGGTRNISGNSAAIVALEAFRHSYREKLKVQGRSASNRLMTSPCSTFHRLRYSSVNVTVKSVRMCLVMVITSNTKGSQ